MSTQGNKPQESWNYEGGQNPPALEHWKPSLRPVDENEKARRIAALREKIAQMPQYPPSIRLERRRRHF